MKLRRALIFFCASFFCGCAAFAPPFGKNPLGRRWASSRIRPQLAAGGSSVSDQDARPVSRPRAIDEVVKKGLALATAAGVRVALAEETRPADVTSKVALDLVSGGKPMGSLVIGLYGKAAPEAVSKFVSVVEGKYRGSISYDGSSVTRVEKGRRIDMGKLPLGSDKYEVREIDWTGRVRRKTLSAADELVSKDFNLLRHDQPGVVSIRRGGGTFEFTVAPATNTDLDKEDTVIGQVLSGLDTLEALENVAVSKDDPLGSKQSFASAGKSFDPRAKLASIYRPLQKITIVKARVVT